MENDSIRPMGKNTVVDVWVDRQVRSITVTEAAIGAYLGFEQTHAMTESDRCEFVRNNLALLIRAARNRLAKVGPMADTILIDVGDLPRNDGRTGDRRATDRRKTERRKSKLPPPSGNDQRKSDRRQADRRSPAARKT